MPERFFRDAAQNSGHGFLNIFYVIKMMFTFLHDFREQNKVIRDQIRIVWWLRKRGDICLRAILPHQQRGVSPSILMWSDLMLALSCETRVTLFLNHSSTSTCGRITVAGSFLWDSGDTFLEPFQFFHIESHIYGSRFWHKLFVNYSFCDDIHTQSINISPLPKLQWRNAAWRPLFLRANFTHDISRQLQLSDRATDTWRKHILITFATDPVARFVK